MSESKIQVKVGIVEFSGEGDQVWLAAQLDKILEKIPELLKIEIDSESNSDKGNEGGNKRNKKGISGLSVINIAGKLNCKSGSDLVIAASAFLHFIESKQTFSRDDLTQTMKKATGYFKNSHLANLTTILAGLEKNNTLTKSSNAYSIHIDKVNELNAILSK
jgi:galactitol-specific phosphotransferase system IIC component